MALHRQIQDATARGVYEKRLLSAIAAAQPDHEVHYLFGGYVVTPKGTPLTCAAMLESLWEKLMVGEVPQATVPGIVLRGNLAELEAGPTEEVNSRAVKDLVKAGRTGE